MLLPEPEYMMSCNFFRCCVPNLPLWNKETCLEGRYARLLYGLVMFHSMANFRTRYGPCGGWNFIRGLDLNDLDSATEYLRVRSTLFFQAQLFSNCMKIWRRNYFAEKCKILPKLCQSSQPFCSEETPTCTGEGMDFLLYRGPSYRKELQEGAGA